MIKKIISIFYLLFVIVVCSFAIYFFNGFINYNAEYVNSKGIADNNSICNDIDTFNNNSKIGTQTSCKTFFKFPPATSSTGANFDQNVSSYNLFLDSGTKKYVKGDKAQIYYKPSDINKSATIILGSFITNSKI